MRAMLGSSPDEVRKVCASVTDWPRFIEQVQKEGMIGLIARAVGGAGFTLAEAVQARLDERLLGERIWQAHLVNSVERIATVFQERCVTAIHLKGPVLSERLYGDARLRPSCDLDLLVRPADVQAAVAALGSLAYRFESAHEAEYELRHRQHLRLVHPRMPPIELHFHGHIGFGTVLEADDLVERAQQYRSPEGGVFPILSAEDEFLYLSVHAAAHVFSRFLWLVDIKTLWDKNPGLDWQTIFARAHACRLGVVLAFTLQAIDRYFGVKDTQIQHYTRTQLQRRPDAARMLEWLEKSPAFAPHARAVSLLLRSRLCEHPGLSMKQLERHVLHGLLYPVTQWLTGRGQGVSP